MLPLKFPFLIEISQSQILLVVGITIVLTLTGFVIFRRMLFHWKRNILLKEQNQDFFRQKIEFEAQKNELEKKSAQLRDSIEYARRIQDALFNTEQMLSINFPESFVFQKPKDIVSGDFLYVSETARGPLIAMADCTGHGVPGALLAVAAYSLLEESLNSGFESPDKLLENLNNSFIKAFHPWSENSPKSGIDLAALSVDKENRKLYFSGARGRILIVGKNSVREFRGEAVSIGEKPDCIFPLQEISLSEQDTVFVFSDGFPDQKGGPAGKKFMMEPFRNFLKELAKLPLKKSPGLIDRELRAWMADRSQMDDILIAGFRIE